MATKPTRLHLGVVGQNAFQYSPIVLADLPNFASMFFGFNPFWSSMGALIRENVCHSSWRLELHILSFEGLSDSDYQWPSGGPWRCDPYAPLMET